MAGAFVALSTQYLEVSTAALTAMPLTMACWFNSDTITASQNLITISDNTVVNRSWGLRAAGATAGDPIHVVPNNSGAAAAATTVGYSANTWHHATGVFTSTTSRDAYIDGGSAGSSASSATAASGSNTTSIGRILTSGGGSAYMSGRIAEVGIWSAALNTSEIDSLAKGVSPLSVRTESLVFYHPIIRDLKNDIVGGLILTNPNGVTVGEHTRVYRSHGAR